MTPGKPDPNPPAGRTFAVAMGALGAMALGLVAAAGVAMVKRLDLPSELPKTNTLNSASLDSESGAPEFARDQPPISARPPSDRNPVPPFQPTPVSVPPIADDPDRPGTIHAPEVLELVELGVTMRREGDTAGALQKLRQADGLLPSHPRILWELASVFKAMSLPDKADDTLVALRALGPASGGEYYELAVHSLGGELEAPSTPAPRLKPAFSFGDTLVTASPNTGDGERVTARLAIGSTLGKPIPATDIGLFIQFYDLVDGQNIEETRSNPLTESWPTSPVDWGEAGIEIVEWEYHMPPLSPEEIAAIGQRQFYGFVARLYYRDELQDVIAEPRTLFALPAASLNPNPILGPAPMLDDALFPN